MKDIIALIISACFIWLSGYWLLFIAEWEWKMAFALTIGMIILMFIFAWAISHLDVK